MEWTKFCFVCFYLLRAKITGKLHQAVFMWCWGSNPRFYECQVPIELHAPDTILILSNRWWLNNSKYIQAIRCCAAIKEKMDTEQSATWTSTRGTRWWMFTSQSENRRKMYVWSLCNPCLWKPWWPPGKGGRDGQRLKQVPSWPCYYMAKWRTQNQKEWWLGLCTSLLNRPGS